jgi:transposase-like protein
MCSIAVIFFRQIHLEVGIPYEETISAHFMDRLYERHDNRFRVYIDQAKALADQRAPLKSEASKKSTFLTIMNHLKREVLRIHKPILIDFTQDIDRVKVERV